MAAPIELNDRAFLAIAIPVMLSNLTTPLIGVVDTAAVGRLPEAYHIGAVALGGVIFSFVFWTFGFLRMGTSGFVAQAEGAGDDQEMRDVLVRALGLALGFGVLMILLQPIIGKAAFYLIEGSGDVEREAHKYFAIRIWSAPAALANYVYYGFLIGIGRSRAVMFFVILVNGLNIVLDVFFVLGMGMAADGVALGTVIAEYTGAAWATWLVLREFAHRAGHFTLAAARRVDRMKRMMAVNTDILIRTVCLVFAFAWFTSRSATAGDTVLAANVVLMEFFAVLSNFLDGFSFATESYVGRAIGARRRDLFRRAIGLAFRWGLITGAVVSAGFFLLGGVGIDMLTTNEEVRAVARVYLPWAAMAPLIGFSCFLLDGIFIGATQTRDMRNMMLVTLALYLVFWWVLVAGFDNHGRWAALMVLFVLRAATLAMCLPRLDRDHFGMAQPALR